MVSFQKGLKEYKNTHTAARLWQVLGECGQQDYGKCLVSVGCYNQCPHSRD